MRVRIPTEPMTVPERRLRARIVKALVAGASGTASDVANFINDPGTKQAKVILEEFVASGFVSREYRRAERGVSRDVAHYKIIQETNGRLAR